MLLLTANVVAYLVFRYFVRFCSAVTHVHSIKIIRHIISKTCNSLQQSSSFYCLIFAIFFLFITFIHIFKTNKCFFRSTLNNRISYWIEKNWICVLLHFFLVVTFNFVINSYLNNRFSNGKCSKFFHSKKERIKEFSFQYCAHLKRKLFSLNIT